MFCSEREALSLLIAGGVCDLGRVPDLYKLFGSLLPIDVAASTIIDIAHAEDGELVYNIASSPDGEWANVARSLSQNGLSFKTVTLSEFIAVSETSAL